MAHPTAVVNVVGLTPGLLAHAPRLAALAAAGEMRRLRPVLPAVTCSVQSSMLTGAPVRDHGAVGNGWFDRALAEVHFWKQSNRLVAGEKVWDTARRRDPSVTCANLFWWFNMHSSADVCVTPRPIYKADGRKIPDVHTEPPELRGALQAAHGRFPLFQFWGPGAAIASSRWIARAAIDVHERFWPTLLLVYLPHLDYDLQRFGPDDPRALRATREIDDVAGDLIDRLCADGRRVIALSEYGIEAVDRPIAINRILRDGGGVRVREEDGRELLDPGGSDAFAVADHQVAHVYVKDPACADAWAESLRSVEGVDLVLGERGKAEHGVDHARAGDLVLVAERGAWFDYAWWRDDARAPDYARTVDIHRKPGYDPRELLIDPALRWPKLSVATRLLRRKLGFRTLMDVVPLDARLVGGSHGRVDQRDGERPVVIGERGLVGGPDEMPCTAVRDVILRHLFE
jgi:predicted AlkP superfamily pyrophosphatase or phosphodiesterase